VSSAGRRFKFDPAETERFRREKAWITNLH
jgi:hypothetical protein